MATVISLLDATLIRIGNSQYAKENRSYGLTTLRNKHVEVKGGQILFEFRGKSGVEHKVSVKDRRLANVIKRCMELPGQNLFQYLDEDGVRHAVTSSDINAYLQSLTGSDFTAKDYRTWAASALALATLQNCTGSQKPTPNGTSSTWSRQSRNNWATPPPSAENATSTRRFWKASCSATSPNSPLPTTQRPAPGRSCPGELPANTG